MASALSSASSSSSILDIQASIYGDNGAHDGDREDRGDNADKAEKGGEGADDKRDQDGEDKWGGTVNSGGLVDGRGVSVVMGPPMFPHGSDPKAVGSNRERRNVTKENRKRKRMREEFVLSRYNPDDEDNRKQKLRRLSSTTTDEVEVESREDLRRMFPASELPEGFPPDLAFRALACYASIRTLSIQLRLSPFTPVAFLRGLYLPFPNRLIGKIHVAILRILLCNLQMGYHWGTNSNGNEGSLSSERGGGASSTTANQNGLSFTSTVSSSSSSSTPMYCVSKRRKLDGIRWPLRAGDRLEFLDEYTWPIFFDDYCHLTADFHYAAINSTAETSTIDVRRNLDVSNIVDHHGSALDYAAPTTVAVVAATSSSDAAVAATRDITDRVDPASPEQVHLESFDDDDDEDTVYEDEEGEDEAEATEERKHRSRQKSRKKKRKTKKRKEKKKVNGKHKSVTRSRPIIEDESTVDENEHDDAEAVGDDEKDAEWVFDEVYEVDDSDGEYEVPTQRAMNMKTKRKATIKTKSSETSKSRKKAPSQSTSKAASPARASRRRALPTRNTASTSKFSRPPPPNFGRITSITVPSPLARRQSHPHQSHPHQLTTWGYGGHGPASWSQTAGLAQPPWFSDVSAHAMNPGFAQPSRFFSAQRMMLPTASAATAATNLSRSMIQQHVATQQPWINRRMMPFGTATQSATTTTESRVFDTVSVSPPPPPTPLATAATLATPSQTALQCERAAATLSAPGTENKCVSTALPPPAAISLASAPDCGKGLLDTPTDDCSLSVDGEEVDEVSRLLTAFIRGETEPKGRFSDGEKCALNDKQVKARDVNAEGLETEMYKVKEEQKEKPPGGDLEHPQWSHFRALSSLRSGTPYHRLSVKKKLDILEYLLDEMLTVARIVDDLTLRDVGEASVPFQYGRLPSAEELDDLENQDECAVCTKVGDLLCCDGCVSSYHKGCLDMPLDGSLPEGRWLCPECTLRDPAMLGPLRAGRKRALEWFRIDEVDTSEERNSALPTKNGANENLSRELLLVHGFLFSRDRSGSGISELPRPVDLSCLRKRIASLGQSLLSKWPLAQLPFDSTRVWQDAKLRSDESYLQLRGSYDPSFYHNKYRKAPQPPTVRRYADAHQCEYETNCTLAATDRITAALSRDLSKDRTIQAALRQDASLFDSFQLIRAYLLSVRARLSKAVLLDLFWDDSRSSSWCGTVNRTKSTQKMSRLLAELVDAAHPRAFQYYWFQPVVSGRQSGIHDVKVVDTKTFSTSEGFCMDDESMRRKWERAPFSAVPNLVLRSASPDLGAWIHRLRPEYVRSIESRRKRKRNSNFQDKQQVESAPSLDPIASNDLVVKVQTKSCSPDDLLRQSYDPSNVVDRAASDVIPATFSSQAVGSSALPEDFTSHSVGDSSELETQPFPQEGLAESVACGVFATTSQNGEAGSGTAPGSKDEECEVSGAKTKGVIETPSVEALAQHSHHAGPAVKGKVKKGRARPGRKKKTKQTQLIADDEKDKNGSNAGSRRRSSRQADRHVSQTGSMLNDVARKGGDSIVEIQQRVKLTEMIDSISTQPMFEAHWPVAGRKLFDPVGYLPPSVVRRLARRGGCAAAPFVSYLPSYEVGQVSASHVWRKKVTQCTSFEELLLHIRVIESFLDSSTIRKCSTIATRYPGSRDRARTEILGSHKDPATGIDHHFVGRVGQAFGHWESSLAVDLTPLICERCRSREDIREKRRQKEMRALMERQRQEELAKKREFMERQRQQEELAKKLKEEREAERAKRKKEAREATEIARKEKEAREQEIAKAAARQVIDRLQDTARLPSTQNHLRVAGMVGACELPPKMLNQQSQLEPYQGNGESDCDSDSLFDAKDDNIDLFQRLAAVTDSAGMPHTSNDNVTLPTREEFSHTASTPNGQSESQFQESQSQLRSSYQDKRLPPPHPPSLFNQLHEPWADETNQGHLIGEIQQQQQRQWAAQQAQQQRQEQEQQIVQPQKWTDQGLQIQQRQRATLSEYQQTGLGERHGAYSGHQQNGLGGSLNRRQEWPVDDLFRQQQQQQQQPSQQQLGLSHQGLDQGRHMLGQIRGSHAFPGHQEQQAFQPVAPLRGHQALMNNFGLVQNAAAMLGGGGATQQNFSLQNHQMMPNQASLIPGQSDPFGQRGLPFQQHQRQLQQLQHHSQVLLQQEQMQRQQQQQQQQQQQMLSQHHFSSMQLSNGSALSQAAALGLGPQGMVDAMLSRHQGSSVSFDPFAMGQLLNRSGSTSQQQQQRQQHHQHQSWF